MDLRGQADLAHQQARLTATTHPSVDSATELLRTAQAVDAAGAPSGQALLEALTAAAEAGRLGPGTRVVVDDLPSTPTATGLSGELLGGLTQRFTRGFAAGYPVLHRTLDRATHGEDARWLWLTSRVAADLWADDCWETLATAALNTAKHSGSLLLMPPSLTEACLVLMHRGEFDEAARLLRRIDATTSAIQAPRHFTAALLHAAWRATDEAAAELIRTARQAAQRHGHGAILATAALSEAILNNGLGRYSDALAAAQTVLRHDELLTYGWAASEVVEAASRTGQSDAGHRALAALTERTQLARTDSALGVEARSRAVLTVADPEPLYREAVERLSRTRIATDLARARLVYGEWLRRQGRRVDARAELLLARRSLTSMGATAFAERANREYLAAGEKVRHALVRGRPLTPQEARITAMARQGLTNPEMGERLYLSPRTVEYHLHKVFEKLGIGSRRDLVHAVPDLSQDSPPESTQYMP